MEEKYVDTKLEALAEALEAYFAGEINLTQVEEATDGVVKRKDFVEELDRLTCHHPHCSEYYPCRSAKRRNGGTMCCTLLTDTQFNGYTCPFFKTKEEYEREFWQTYTAERPIIDGRVVRKYIRIIPGKEGGEDNGTPSTD